MIFPCTSFYEKESDGTIYEYVSDDGFFLYLAGFYNNEGSFVLLTEKADRFRLSRVPVLIPEDQVSSYLMGLYDTKNLTKRKRPVFHRKGDWVQMSLF